MYKAFENRRNAGILLARKLRNYAGRSDAIVLALPRGGVPVAYEEPTALSLPLDVLVVRKLGAPHHEDFALGAIAAGGVCLVDQEAVMTLHVTKLEIEEIVERERLELERRERLYRGARRPLDLRGKTAIVVDDGLATGLTMRAAVDAIRKLGPKEVIVGIPVCAPVTCEELQNGVDIWCVCVQAPETFYAVGQWYKDFRQTSDQEVQRLLACADAGQVSALHYV
jgi:predicted phosphoribosyltransferase